MADINPPNDRSEQDAAHNPSQQGADELLDHKGQAQSLHAQENDAGRQATQDPASGSDTSNPAGNIRDASAQESARGDWKNGVTGDASPKKTIKQQLQQMNFKKGPLALIIAALIGGGSVMTVLFSPGLLIINVKEKFVEKFNDQLAVMDDQTTMLLRKKFTGQGTITGCKKLSIRCKFNTMSERQVKRLEKKSGGAIKVKTSGDVTLIKGRYKIDSYEFNGKTITADNFVSELRSNPEFRAAMRKGYNPKLAGFADSLYTKLTRKVGANKQKTLTGKTKEDLKQNLVKTASGAASAELDTKVISTTEDCDGGEGCENGKRTVYRDTSTGQKLTKAEYDARIASSTALKGELDARKSLGGTTGKLAKSTLKGALTVSALGLGAIDSACTGYVLIRAVGFAAKYLGQLQLLRYFYMFGNEADATKALEQNPEAVSYLGEIMTTPNAEGKTFTDSFGYHNTAYGEISGMPSTDNIQAENVSSDGGVTLGDEQKEQVLLDDEVTRYVNGQMISDNLLTSVIRLTGQAGTVEEADSTCGFIKSGWGQTIVIGAALAGAIVAFFSGGASLGWGAAAQASVSISLAIAMAMLTPKLVSMAAGTLITGEENGNEAGNAATAGAEAHNYEAYMARGVPTLEVEDAVAYKQRTNETLAMYAEEERATRSPFDPTSQHTFVGSIVSSLLPYTSKMRNTSSIIPTTLALISNSFSRLTPSASAQDPSAEFKICRDRDYRDKNIATGAFCGPRGGLSDKVLNMDMDSVVTYMEDNNYIEKDSETGAPKDSDNEYAKYIEDCMSRTVPLGGYTESNPDKGEKCIQKGSSPADEVKYENFRKLFIVASIDDGMENDYASSQASPSANNGTVVSPVAPGHTVTSGYGPRGAVPGAPGGTSWHAAIDMVGTPRDVFSAMDGEVVSVQGTGVNVVTIKHADGLKTRYMHMWPKDVIVKAGDKVTAGQKIGVIGCAGRDQGYCSGDHLDFSIWIDEVIDKSAYGKYKLASVAAGNNAGRAINPANFLTDNGVQGYAGHVNQN